MKPYRYPVGTMVVVGYCSVGGTTTNEITGYVGPYSVILDGKEIAPVELIRGVADEPQPIKRKRL